MSTPDLVCFTSGMNVMQNVYQQKIMDMRARKLYRCKIFFADPCGGEQIISALPLGGDSRLYPFKEMISHLITVISRLPNEVQHLMSINVANTILVDPDMLDVFFEALVDLPYGLSIEVTPLGDLPEPRKLNAVFRALRQLNCTVEFANFGGPNSQKTSILSEYAFDSVELNSTFVQSALSDERRTRLLALITDMIKTQGKLSVATGVSTSKQSETLAALGVVLQQGDFIHSPELVS